MYYLTDFILLFSIALLFMLPFFIYTKRRKIRVARFSKTQYTLHDLRRFLKKEYTISLLLNFPITVLYSLFETFPHDIDEMISVDQSLHHKKSANKTIKKPRFDTELGKQLWNMYRRAYFAEYAISVQTCFHAENEPSKTGHKRIDPALFRILCMFLLLIFALYYFTNYDRIYDSHYLSSTPVELFFGILLLYPPLVILLVTELYNFLRKKSAVKEPEEIFPEELPQTPSPQQSWLCTCGRENPSYIYTCVCGESKSSRSE